MTTLERIGFEIAGAVALLVAAVILWKVHNWNEQKLGAQQCIQATTETKAAARAENIVDESKQAGVLAQAADYEKTIAGLHATNVDLARRLYASNQVRAGRLPDPGAAACDATAERRLPDSERAARLARVLDTCDTDHAKVIGLAKAYESARQLALDAKEKSDTK